MMSRFRYARTWLLAACLASPAAIGAWPNGPTEDPQFGDLTHCFKPVSGEARTVADDVRDTILKTAQGRVARKGYRVPMTVFHPKKG